MGLPNIGPLELIIILAIALLIVGPGRLPEMGSAVGRTIREFRKASSDMTDSIKVETDPNAAKKDSATQADAPAIPAVAATAATPAVATTPAVADAAVAPASVVAAPTAATEEAVAAPVPAATEEAVAAPAPATAATVESAAVDVATEPDAEAKKTDAAEQT